MSLPSIKRLPLLLVAVILLHHAVSVTAENDDDGPLHAAGGGERTVASAELEIFSRERLIPPFGKLKVPSSGSQHFSRLLVNHVHPFRQKACLCVRQCRICGHNILSSNAERE